MDAEFMDMKKVTKKNCKKKKKNEKYVLMADLQTYLTQILYCRDSVLLGKITSLFLLLRISNQSILDRVSESLEIVVR